MVLRLVSFARSGLRNLIETGHHLHSSEPVVLASLFNCPLRRTALTRRISDCATSESCHIPLRSLSLRSVVRTGTG